MVERQFACAVAAHLSHGGGHFRGSMAYRLGPAFAFVIANDALPPPLECPVGPGCSKLPGQQAAALVGSFRKCLLHDFLIPIYPESPGGMALTRRLSL